MNYKRNLEELGQEVHNMETAYIRALSYDEKLYSHEEELDEKQFSKYCELRDRLVKSVDRGYYFVNKKLQ